MKFLSTITSYPLLEPTNILPSLSTHILVKKSFSNIFIWASFWESTFKAYNVPLAPPVYNVSFSLFKQTCHVSHGFYYKSFGSSSKLFLSIILNSFVKLLTTKRLSWRDISKTPVGI